MPSPRSTRWLARRDGLADLDSPGAGRRSKGHCLTDLGCKIVRPESERPADLVQEAGSHRLLHLESGGGGR